MRALVCRNWGTFDDLVIEERPSPAPGPGQIRFRMAAAGVGLGASLVVAGKYQRKPPLPFVPGTEATGIVTAIGPGVTRFAIGDPVMAALDWGGYAEEVIAFEQSTWPVPPALSADPARAIPLVISYPTAYGALVWRAKLGPTETLLVYGASGGVGLPAIEIGKALGARVIAAAGSDEKRRVAREHGADVVIDSRSADLRGAIRAVAPDGVDVVLDSVGGDAFEAALRTIRPDGRIVTIGFAGGAIPSAPLNILMVKNAAVLGFYLGLYMGWSDPADRSRYWPQMAAMYEQMFAWAEAGALHPRISHRVSLARPGDAMRALTGRQSIGKVVLVP
jgi:NADPH2:quinone reductase